MSPWLTLQRQLKAVADLVADTGNAELPQDHDVIVEPDDLTGTVEAASMLGLTRMELA